MTKLIDFSKFTSVKIGGIHEVLLVDSVQTDIGEHVIIGGGNNLLVSPNPAPMAILSDKFDYIKLEDEILEIGAKVKSGKIYNFAKKQNLSGFEFLQNIPGTLGGMIKMNAGLCGISISDNLLEVRFKRGWVKKEEINFAYRHSGINEPVFAAKFKISYGFDENLAKDFAQKRSNQPKGASFGSCFVNPANDYAGRLIEAVGLKGHTIGGAKFSERHANFLINFNNASFEDAINLINLAKKSVLEKFGIELKTEVVII